MKLTARRLVTGEEQRTLDFLSRQPLQNVALIGLIQDHGLESPYHRGQFYGCFRGGWLSGVALVGYRVMMSGDREALAAFTEAACLFHASELGWMLGDPETIANFLRLIAELNCRLTISREESYWFCALTSRAGELTASGELRVARMDEAEEVVEAHAAAYFEQCGIEPLRRDPDGFRQRVQTRISQGRVWVWCDQRGIAFKADIIAETDQAAYLEGVWTRPDRRGQGLGSRAMKLLSQRLLRRHYAICLFARSDDPRVFSFYRRLGFEALMPYQLLRFQPQTES